MVFVKFKYDIFPTFPKIQLSSQSNTRLINLGFSSSQLNEWVITEALKVTFSKIDLTNVSCELSGFWVFGGFTNKESGRIN